MRKNICLAFMALLSCTMLTSVSAQYSLTVESAPAAFTPGHTIYRFYVNMADATDKFSAVYGNDQENLIINTPSGTFNSPYNAGWSASGINPFFLGVFPDLAEDTYATIGLDGPASGTDADPSLVEDSNLLPTISNYFVNGGTNLSVNTLTGGSWYVLNTATNALPDANLRVIIMQITTTGTVDGIINFQVFPLGVGANQQQISIAFNGVGTFTAGGAPVDVLGCTDMTACNYDAAATLDDGTCAVLDECGVCGGSGIAAGACNCAGDALDALGVCGGTCAADVDGNGVCDNAEILGCMDSTACNYDMTATQDDGSCAFLDALGVCGGTCAADVDGNGVCDNAEVLGCMDSTACNYNMAATQDDGSCAALDALGVCGGTCAADVDGNGVCDNAEVLGCMDANACNYDNTATQNDGSCDFCSCGGGGGAASPYTLTVEPSASATVAGHSIYRFYVNMTNPTDKFSAVYGNDQENLIVNTPAGIFNSPANASWSASGINPVFLAFFPDMADDSYATIGLDGPATGGAADPSLVEDVALSPTVSSYFVNGGTGLNVNTLTGASWYVLNTATNALPDPSTLRVLVMQITTAGPVDGTINFQVFPLGVGADQQQVSIDFTGPGTFTSGGSTGPSNACGCTDSTASNYDPAAVYDDGSCIPTVNGCTDSTACNYDPTANFDDGTCTVLDECGVCGGSGIAAGACNCAGDILDALGVCGGTCAADVDGNGVCDNAEVPGCMDSTACNYDMTATQDDGTCAYLDALGVCGGTCAADVDGNGVCDDAEILGCMDSTACNYNMAATQDDGSCAVVDECGVCGGSGIAAGACNCAGDTLDALGVCGGACAADVDGNGVCDNAEILGCMDATACNYDMTATQDDGSCAVVDECGVCGGTGIPAGDCDCNGNQLDALGVCGGACAADVDGNGVCDNAEVLGCMDSTSCNYNMAATQDDGSCAVIDECGVCGGSGIAAGACNCAGDILDALGICGGTCTADVDGNGICDNNDIAGCTDSTACNYNMAATQDNGTCAVLDALGVCGGTCTADVDGDGICDNVDPCVGTLDQCGVCNGDGTSCEGCLDPLACDYNPSATIQATVPGSVGSLSFAWTSQSSWFSEISFDVDGVTYNGNAAPVLSLAVGTYTITGFDSFGDGWNGGELTITDDFSGTSVVLIVTASTASVDIVVTAGSALLCDFTSCAGCTDSTACNYDSTSTIEDGSCTYEGVLLGCDGLCLDGGVYYQFSITDAYSDGMCCAYGNGSYSIVAGGVEVGFGSDFGAGATHEFCAPSDACIQVIFIADNYPSEQAWSLYADGVHIGGAGLDGSTATHNFGNCIVGCTDSTACNYDATANLEDGTCTYAAQFLNCDGSCQNDSDGDGVCDELEIAGCVVPGACNYSLGVTDLIPCIYPVPGYLCDGTCDGDIDGDGICDANEILGCQDSTACNYDASATDAGACDYTSCLGCTDSLACNYSMSATQEDGSCDYCSCDNAAGGQNGFGLQLEQVSTDGINTTYRVYVTTPGPTDFVSSVSGDVSNPSFLRTTTSFFQSNVGGLTADLINPLFFTLFPELQVDSWLTIGIDQAPVAGEGSISTAVATGDTWTSDFENGGNLELNSFFGGSWFALNNVSNGFAGADNRVLVAQLTTDGNITGSLYTQIFPNGDSSQELLLNLSFGTVGCGCTDVTACNYDPSATYDDGSCAINDECGVCGGSGIAAGACNCAGDSLDALGVCGGACTADVDADGICDDIDPCVGQLDSCGVCNGPGAIYDCGCAPIPAGDCDCNGNVLDECGVCGGAGITPGACDCSGTLPATGYDCFGNCLVDTDGDGVCDMFEVLGCTDATACNYDALATDEDGSCTYLQLTELPGGAPACGLFFSGYAEGSGNNKFLEIYNPTDAAIDLTAYAFPSVSNAPTTPGSYEYWNTFPAGATIAAGDVYVIAHGSADSLILAQADHFHTYLSNGDDGYMLVLGTTASFVQIDAIGDWNGDPGSGWAVAGTANGTQNHSLIRKSDVNSGNGGDWITSAGTDVVNSEWIVLPINDWTGLGSHDFTGTCTGAATAYVYDCNGVCFNDADGDGVCDELEIPGCTDSAACNYDAAATDNDGTCESLTCAGCTDMTACNYDATATIEDGSCWYAAAFHNCDGSCINDLNLNGICDEEEIQGCMYIDACNYDSIANVEDGSCDFACLTDGCTDSTAVNFNSGASVDDGSCLFIGCMDPGALNYDAAANLDCGCQYPDACPGDFNGDNEVDVSDLLDFFQLWGNICQ